MTADSLWISAEAACDGQLIVPMSIVRDDYFDEIVGGLAFVNVALGAVACRVLARLVSAAAPETA